MADQKVTTMVLKVDLQCRKCCKKIKKILAKFPEIQSQTYDEKANTVTITVVCSSPEKFRDKLCYKGRKVIKCIEIKEPPKPKPPPEKPKEPEKPKPKDPPLCPPTCIPVYLPMPTFPVPPCHRPIPCSVPACDRPCYCGCGVPVRPCQCGGYGHGCGCGCGGIRGGNVSRCDNYFNEENATGCTIM